MPNGKITPTKMYSLEIIRAINARPPVRTETETTRHCSFSGNAERGIVLHSARQRSTAFLSDFQARMFLLEWRHTAPGAKRDELIEAYF